MPPLILAIDDDPNILQLVRSVLSGEYDVVTLGSANDAIRELKAGFRPNLILCDIHMPDRDGFELHEFVRSSPPLRSVPFVYLTALTQREYQRRGMLLGADDFLTKPFRASELRESIRVRLERAAALQRQTGGLLVIRSLGGFEVTFEGKRVHYEAGKVAEALLYLVRRGEAPNREFRADLWSEGVTENNLYVLYTRIRKAVEGFAEFSLPAGAVRLTLTSDFSWDALEFERAAGDALESRTYVALDGAAMRYGGEFLPGFGAPWVLDERSRLEALYLQVLEAAVDAAPNDGAARSARQRLEAFGS